MYYGAVGAFILSARLQSALWNSTMASQEDIRAKRLARLGASSASPSTTPKAVPSSSASINTASTSSSTTNVETKPAPVVEPVVAAAAVTKPNSSTSSVSQIVKPSTEPFEEWVNKTIESSMDVTIDRSKTNLMFLSSIYDELMTDDDDKTKHYLSVDSIEQILVDIFCENGLNTDKYPNPFEYLLSAYNSTKKAKRIIKTTDPMIAEKNQVLDEISKYISSYFLILFQVPDMFQNYLAVDDSINLLINKIDSLDNNMDSLLVNAIEVAIENESLLEFMEIVLTNLSAKLYHVDLTLIDSTATYLKYFKIFEIFLSNKQCCFQIPNISNFKPPVNNNNSNDSNNENNESEDNGSISINEYESKTLLGPLLRISPLVSSIATSNYGDIMDAEIQRSDLAKIHSYLQIDHKNIIQRLFGLIEKLIRSNEATRNQVLEYFAVIVNKNHLRRGEHVNLKQISSDSFMINITFILIKFAQPFLSTNKSLINKISKDFLLHENTLIDLKDETRINSTMEEFNEYYNEQLKEGKVVKEELSFISKTFYLLLAYIHYGIGGIYINYRRSQDYSKQLKEQIKQFEEYFRLKNLDMNNPMVKPLIESRLAPIQKKLKRLNGVRYSIEMFASNRDLQLEVFECIIGSIEFFRNHLMGELDTNEENLNSIINNDDNIDRLDDLDYLRKLSPIPFRYFPECFIEGLVNYCHFISRFSNNPLIYNKFNVEKFVEFSIIILRYPQMINNPHLKSRLIEVLFYGSIPLQDNSPGFMIDIFNNNSFIKNNLIYSLLNFYVLVERTGSSSQFYDKFNSRFHISFILEQLWKYDYFKTNLYEISTSEKTSRFFIKLIARMLNDTTFLLDESLTQLITIGSIQRELKTRAMNGNNISEDSPYKDETDEELNKKLSTAENQARSYTQLSNKTILLFNLFTKEIPKSFVIPELVDRLAAMLDYNLVMLVGSKYNDLKVSNPEKYQFTPIELLYQICSIFINLSHEEEFVEAVSKDERSFHIECFYKSIEILYKQGKITSDFENDLKTFAEKALELKNNEIAMESELGDVPDEFLDPLMFTIMKDPVILPHSKISIDRSVIKAHLMNDPTDPFNRTPLKLEDVIDDVELKTKIQDFIKAAMNK